MDTRDVCAQLPWGRSVIDGVMSPALSLLCESMKGSPQICRERREMHSGKNLVTDCENTKVAASLCYYKSNTSEVHSLNLSVYPREVIWGNGSAGHCHRYARHPSLPFISSLGRSRSPAATAGGSAPLYRRCGAVTRTAAVMDSRSLDVGHQ